MKKIAIYLCGLWACCLAACSDNDEIGYVESWEDEYVLPQGKSDADDRIVDFYEQYGTYVLYEYTYLDFRYELTTYEFELADPVYVGDMLDFLNEIWFDFYPEDFKKKYLPLKIFLAEYIGGYRCFVGSACVGIAYCNESLLDFTPEEKSKFMRDLQTKLWSNYLDVFEVPEEFFEMSSYTTEADTDPESANYARKRGFVDQYNVNGGEPYAWYTWFYEESSSKRTDLLTFINGMILRSSADWEEDLKWPLVKQKYDLLRNWLIDTYGVDLQKIGDKTFE